MLKDSPHGDENRMFFGRFAHAMRTLAKQADAQAGRVDPHL
jgi:hypothetical protein